VSELTEHHESVPTDHQPSKEGRARRVTAKVGNGLNWLAVVLLACGFVGSFLHHHH
jgi:hypothetical protein